MIPKIFTKKWVIFSIIGASLGSIAISVPLIYYALTRSVEVEINKFEPKTLTSNLKSASIFSNSDLEKINSFILEGELKKGTQKSDYALKSNFQVEYDYESANQILAILKMSNNINQFDKVKSLLKDVPTIMQRPGFGLSGEYEVSNIHFNINPINNVPKLVNFISRYYDKNKKQFIDIKDDFWDLAWNIYYFKLNGHDFLKYFDIKDWIRTEFKKMNFESEEVLLNGSENPESLDNKDSLLTKKYISILSIINTLGNNHFSDIIKEKQKSINILIEKWDKYFRQIIENQETEENIRKLDILLYPIFSFYHFSKNFYKYSSEYLSKINEFTKNWLVNFKTNSDTRDYAGVLLYYYFGNNKNLEPELLKKSEEIVDYVLENRLFRQEADITKTIFVKQILELSEKKDNQVQKINQTIETLFNQTTEKPENNPDFFADLYNYVFFSIKTHPDFLKSQKDFLNTIIGYSKFVKKPIDFFYLSKTIALLNNFYNTDKPAKINVSKQIFDNIMNAKLEKNAPFFLKFINLFIKFIFKNELDDNKEIVEFINQNLDEKNINNAEFLEHLFWYIEFQSAIKSKLEHQIDSTKLEKFISLLKQDILDKIDRKIGKTHFLNVKTIYMTYQIDWLLKNDKN
ncbi:hypothetical protein Q4497_01660 [Mesomycoplasma ovipneumoniae]|uniref:Uncharacterized protein n=1 Tax=Mesomycoplasma ovipneumoniae TaxID=29562 RepID=A0AAW6Q7J1_9BACT|nr:hypothetical protein [Mesomycoplasma ovipneumoniae]MDF9627600.1 hypothetical protein [Mesomycoplasma ovipneumoniae]MDO4157672.1 hypothetical protein [Mesomycoplasma ovipneumoniae]MDO4158377.1 hypothetical protein [Mesomycoplasma ovipneumoniae]MDO6821732.1 hypothetical protein [Mesomycoplasma ovipneumoniae]MDO6855460.1 hypothetical protein [Mesomycoplasma ovipneumoniae]